MPAPDVVSRVPLLTQLHHALENSRGRPRPPKALAFLTRNRGPCPQLLKLQSLVRAGNGFIPEFATRLLSDRRVVVSRSIPADPRHPSVGSVSFIGAASARDASMVEFFLGLLLPALASTFCKQASPPTGIQILLALLPDKKRFPDGKSSRDKVLKPVHVNSGVTFFTPGLGPTIFIFRREEHLKVLTHELIHAFGADAFMHGSQDVDGLENEIAHAIRLDTTKLGFGEAYVDALAIMAYALLASFLTGADPAAVIRDQRQHVVATAACLLLSQGSARFAEQTHAFAYYVCKAALLSNDDALGGLPPHGVKNMDEARKLVACVMRGLPFLAKALPLVERDRLTASARMSVAQLAGLVDE